MTRFQSDISCRADYILSFKVVKFESKIKLMNVK